MDLRGLKIDAADQRREIELLEALHAEFCAYVETLRALIAGGVEPAEFEAVRYALHLHLHEQEHSFPEWHEGEASLDSDIFGLVDDPETYQEHRDVDHAEGRANARFRHVIDKERRKLAATESRIAALSEGSPADVTREGIFFKGQHLMRFGRCRRFSRTPSVTFSLSTAMSMRAFSIFSATSRTRSW